MLCFFQFLHHPLKFYLANGEELAGGLPEGRAVGILCNIAGLVGRLPVLHLNFPTMLL